MRCRRFVRSLAALVMITAVGASATGASAQAEGKPNRGRDVHVQLLSFNDFHGWLETPTGSNSTLGPDLDPSETLVGGGEYLATTLENLREGHKYSLTVAAGDLIGGSPFLSGVFHDEPSVESLNAMGLDVSSVGNHEFDEGAAELLRMQNGGCHPVDGCYFPEEPYGGADFQWLSANVVDTASGETLLPATWIEKVRGVKIGFIGMTLEGTPEIVAAAGIAGLEFRDEVEAGNRAARQLRRNGVKAIVVLLHEGGLNASDFNGCDGISGPIVDIAQNLSAEIDLLITGHTHQPYVCDIPDPAGDSRLVTSASSFGRVVTETDLVIDKKTRDVDRDATTAVNHLVARTVAPDPTQTAILAKWNALAAPVGDRVVGAAAADVLRGESRAVEGPLVNLIADAQLEATASAGAQIAFMNPGGVRDDLLAGDITYREAFNVQPFSNVVTTMTLTGEQIERLLEQQATAARTLILGVSAGFTFTYDSTAAFGDRIDPASIMLNGAVVDPAAFYTVAVNSFLADGGDGFTVFTEGQDPISHIDDLEALIAYLAAHPSVSPPLDRIAGI